MNSLRLVPGLLVSAAAVLLAGAARADAPGGVPLDWPLGAHDGTQYLPGYGVRVMQNFANPNPFFGNRLHAAVDLALDAGTAHNGVVFAAADGVVTCTTTGVHYPGRVVVVEHTLSDGSTLYTQYGHLNHTLSVVPGQIVSRGAVIGSLVYQELNGMDNSHLHFEVRSFANWAPGNCQGPGYADHGRTPEQQGWLDPLRQYFSRRPSFPGGVVAAQTLNYRDAPSRSSSVVLGQFPAGQRVAAHAVVPDQSGSYDWWYRVLHNGGWVYVAAYWSAGWGGDLYFSELRRDPDPLGIAGLVVSGGQLHAFARHTDGRTLYRRRAADGSWNAWSSLGGFASSEPVPAANHDGRLQVIVRGADGTLWTRWETAVGGSWAAWTNLAAAGSARSAPAVARNQDGRLQAFVRWSDGSLRTRSQSTAGGSSWTAWTSLGGVLHSAPAATANTDGRLEVFVLGLNNDLYRIAQTAPNLGFGTWAGLGGAATSAPTVVRNSNGRLEVFVRGAAHDLRHVAQVAAGSPSWGPWQTRGGSLTSPPAVARNSDGRLEAFVRGTDGRLHNVWQVVAGGSWSATWGDLEGYLTSPPVVERQGTALQALVRGLDRQLYHRGQAGGGWSGYLALGGPFGPF